MYRSGSLKSDRALEIVFSTSCTTSLKYCKAKSEKEGERPSGGGSDVRIGEEMAVWWWNGMEGVAVRGGKQYDVEVGLTLMYLRAS
jgi:hypothetical protein